MRLFPSVNTFGFDRKSSRQRWIVGVLLRRLGIASLVVVLGLVIVTGQRQFLVYAQQKLPVDILSSSEYPDDLIRDLDDDEGAQDCWKDDLSGSNFEWNKDPSDPMVKYKHHYRNTCKKNLNCVVVIASGTRLRDPKAPKRLWRPYRADRRSFAIGPGESVSIDGTLPWTSTELREPAIRDSDIVCWFGK